jgi:hypothetical protein
MRRRQYCPRCGSLYFYRSRRRGLIDSLARNVFRRKKYYCYHCNKHFHLNAEVQSRLNTPK